MPRVTFVKKARKNVKGTDIKKGESYYWWKFRNGGKRSSRSRPKPSQLTQSEFWGAIYGLQESYDTAPSPEELESQRDAIKDELDSIKSEIEDKISNMEQAFPNGCPSLETLTERQEALDSAINDLENVDTDIDDDLGEQAQEDRADEIWQEIKNALDGISCS